MMALFFLGLLVGASPDGAGKSFKVTVDFSAVEREVLGDTALHAAHKNLLLRLAEDGFSVVVDPNQGTDIVVTVKRTGQQNLNILVETSAGNRSRKVRFGEGAGEQEEFQLIQATLELVRGACDELAAQAQSLPSPTVKTQPFGAGLGGGILWSGATAGVRASGDAEVALGALHLTLGLVAHQPLGLPSDLHVFEWGAVVGARMGTHAIASWLLLEAALGGGYLQERYRFSDASGAESQGVLHDPLGTFSLCAALELAHGFRIGADGGAWGTFHTREHVAASGSSWKAPRLRPFLGARLEYLP